MSGVETILWHKRKVNMRRMSVDKLPMRQNLDTENPHGIDIKAHVFQDRMVSAMQIILTMVIMKTRIVFVSVFFISTMVKMY